MEEFRLAIRNGQFAPKIYAELSEAIEAARKYTLEVNEDILVYRLVGETVRKVGWKSK